MSLLTTIANSLTGETVYVSNIPDIAQDNVCCLYRVMGRPADLDLDGISIRNPSFRVLVRDIDYDNAESRMESIINTLTTLQDNGILAIYIESDIIDLGIDDEATNRHRLYCIFRVKAV